MAVPPPRGRGDGQTGGGGTIKTPASARRGKRYTLPAAKWDEQRKLDSSRNKEADAQADAVVR